MDVTVVACIIHILREFKDCLRGMKKDDCLQSSAQKAERCVKPFVIGRKNWLFSNTPGGADVSSVYYSIVETAKLNSLNPYEYVKYLLETLPTINTCDLDELDQLLPWSKVLPDKYRTNVIYNMKKLRS